MGRILTVFLFAAVSLCGQIAPHLLVTGACAPSGWEYCDVSDTAYSGAIGCSCSGRCSNNNYVGATPNVSWQCSSPQYAHVDANAYVGMLEASVLPDRTAFIAYFIFEPHQSKGYAKEGVSALLDHLFEDYVVDVVIAEIDTRNLASIALVKALGFECVAHTLDMDHFKGAASDEYRFELRRVVHQASAIRSC